MIDKYILILVIFTLIGLLVWRQIVFDRREQDLITRLMSSNAVEYAQVNKMLRHTPPVTVADAVDKLSQEGIDAEEILSSGAESMSDRVRVA